MRPMAAVARKCSCVSGVGVAFRFRFRFCLRFWSPLPSRERAGTVRQAVCRPSRDGKVRCSAVQGSAGPWVGERARRGTGAAGRATCISVPSRSRLRSRYPRGTGNRYPDELPIAAPACLACLVQGVAAGLGSTRTRPTTSPYQYVHMTVSTLEAYTTRYLYPPATPHVPASASLALFNTESRVQPALPPPIAPQRIAPRRSPLSAAAMPRQDGMLQRPSQPSRGDRDTLPGLPSNSGLAST